MTEVEQIKIEMADLYKERDNLAKRCHASELLIKEIIAKLELDATEGLTQEKIIEEICNLKTISK